MKTVEKNWISFFIKQHENLKSKFIQKFNYKHSLCKNSKIIQNWFQLVQDIVEKYEILQKNIYNMNEIGFVQEIISICMIIINSERKNCLKLLQSNNQEWTIIIAGINALEWALASMIIFKEKRVSLYKNEIELSFNWIVKNSDNNWIINELELFWIQKVFDKQIKHCMKSQYWLLIMNSHESHCFSEFDAFCMKNQIVFLYMLSHFSHLLQSLNVSCFAFLKQSYKQQIENQIQYEINHVNKMNFLSLYIQAHINIFTK